ncbi:MAG TPA: hypothetical protein VEX38_04575, partial [Fimbriimonadaceae bacterium]|nr:hypothetical protein [Fimbriimonadaceae bacterium]
GPPEPAPIDKAIADTAFFKNTLEAKFVQTWRLAYSLFPADPSDWNGYDRALQELETRLRPDQSWGGRIMNEVFPVFGGAGTAIGKLDAQRRLHRAATKILMDFQTPPRRLPDLGAMGIDPFSGQSFKYRKEWDGFTIYSVGADRRDDGGGQVRNDRTKDVIVKVSVKEPDAKESPR